MKQALWGLFLIITSTANAKGPDTEALYIVPTPDHLVGSSRSYVQIVQRYKGYDTQVISYTFSPELTGNPPLTVELKRVPGSDTLWDSPEVRAACVEAKDIFSCNITFKKLEAPTESTGAKLAGSRQLTAINKDKVKEFLTSKGLSQSLIQDQLDVVDHLESSEPGGILSYEFR